MRYVALFLVLSIVVFTPEFEVLSQEGGSNSAGGIKLGTNNGRFVFGQVSEYRRDQFLLDTETGRMWVLGIDDDSSRILVPIMFYKYNSLKTLLPETEKSAKISDSLSWQRWAKQILDSLENTARTDTTVKRK